MVKEELIDWKEYSCGANGQIYSYLTKRYLSGYIRKDGYVQVGLKCVDENIRLFYWHRVIWTFFYGTIPEGMEINHISEVKTENMLSNLECVDHLTNIRHATGIERSVMNRRGTPRPKVSKALKGRKLSEEHKRKMSESHNKPVVAIDSEGNIAHEYISTHEAEKHGFNQGNVSQCCRKCYMRQGNNYYKGYRWYFKEDYLNEKESERC